jgi:hypothetical protein
MAGEMGQRLEVAEVRFLASCQSSTVQVGNKETQIVPKQREMKMTL